MHSFVVFFFKQKTAYEMRISDWSSDVCSSDLQLGQSFRKMAWHTQFVDADDAGNVAAAINDNTRAEFIESLANPGGVVQDKIGRASCRERVCQYVYISVVAV